MPYRTGKEGTHKEAEEKPATDAMPESEGGTQDNSLTPMSPAEAHQPTDMMSTHYSTFTPLWLNCTPDPYAVFHSQYVEVEHLGEGGYGTVYAGYRKLDHLPIAIKHVPRSKVRPYTFAAGGQYFSLPLEAVLMSTVGLNVPLGSGASVALLDGFQFENELILVMERPIPCMDLFEYIQSHSCYLDEHTAKIIMRELVAAVITLHSRHVLHRDIKPENILIQTTPEGLRLTLIDFGCGTFLTPEPFKDPAGTPTCSPPEYFVDGSYEGDPLSVWQLGVVLYVMLNAEYPFDNCNEVVSKMPGIKRTMSYDCCHFLMSCLQKNPSYRATLDQLQNHAWLRSHPADFEE